MSEPLARQPRDGLNQLRGKLRKEIFKVIDKEIGALLSGGDGQQTTESSGKDETEAAYGESSTSTQIMMAKIDRLEAGQRVLEGLFTIAGHEKANCPQNDTIGRMFQDLSQTVKSVALEMKELKREVGELKTQLAAVQRVGGSEGRSESRPSVYGQLEPNGSPPGVLNGSSSSLGLQRSSEFNFGSFSGVSSGRIEERQLPMPPLTWNPLGLPVISHTQEATIKDEEDEQSSMSIEPKERSVMDMGAEESAPASTSRPEIPSTADYEQTMSSGKVPEGIVEASYAAVAYKMHGKQNIAVQIKILAWQLLRRVVPIQIFKKKGSLRITTALQPNDTIDSLLQRNSPAVAIVIRQAMETFHATEMANSAAIARDALRLLDRNLRCLWAERRKPAQPPNRASFVARRIRDDYLNKKQTRRNASSSF